VARRDPAPSRGKVALDEVQVGAADTADLDLHEDLVRSRLGNVAFHEAQ